MRKATTPSNLGGIYFDAIIKRERTYESDVPEYPTEEGFYVSDAVMKKPLVLSVTAFISDTPVTWKQLRQKNRVSVTIKKLENLYFASKPVKFATSNKSYPDMVISSLTIPETEDMANAVEISLTLKQIRVVKAKTSSIPSSYGLGGNTAESGGTANTNNENDGGTVKKACSILFGLFNK